MGEVRNLREGSLRFVQASGSGSAWATASAPVSGLLGFVADFQFTSAQTLETVKDRGTPSHHKVTELMEIQGSFSVQWGVTGDYPNWTISGSGATVPMKHLEHKATAPEAGGAIYHQFHGVALEQVQFTEGSPANTQQYTFRALAYVGPTASGYLG